MNSRALFLVLPLWLGSGAVALAGVADSKHNLAAPGSVAATANSGVGNEICIFCHTPHNAERHQPLWNRNDSGAAYTPYRSSTSKANIGQPTGASKLCLSCHDGTVALAKVKSRPTASATSAAFGGMRPGRSNLGTDLSDDHPVSFKYDTGLLAANGQLRAPPAGSGVHLDKNGELQCTSCHDPHNGQFPKFLVMNNSASALCLTCHSPNFWRQSSHSLSVKTWNGASPNPWPHTSEKTVMGNGCENCHDPHSAGGKQRLLNYEAEEQNCYSCHNGNVAAKNIQAEFSKTSVHPVIDSTGVHDPMEQTLLPVSSRHVECSDCHDPHASKSGTSSTGGIANGPLAGVRGINASGGAVSQVTYEYELCFRCHAETAKGPARVNRQYPQLNTRLEFQNFAGTNSFHPVVMPGRNPVVPSLKPPYTSASIIGCGDCHNSDGAQIATGSSPRGPHGSAYAPILERPLSLADTGANVANSALCFKCHDFVNTAWAQHLQHIGITSCGTCHDPHGSPNAHLINFNPSIVTGPRGYQSHGLSHGSCTLSCHGKDHNNSAY